MEPCPPDTNLKIAKPITDHDIEPLRDQLLTYGILKVSFGKNKIFDALLNNIKASNPWHRCKFINGDPRSKGVSNSKLRRSSHIFLHDHDNLYAFDSFVFKVFNKSIKAYTYFHNLRINKDSGYKIIRYQQGDFFSTHYDVEIGTRRVSALIYLNDDFEGGSTYFPNHNILIPPKQGDVILFCCSHPFLHESQIVTAGNKFVIFTYFSYHE